MESRDSIWTCYVTSMSCIGVVAVTYLISEWLSRKYWAFKRFRMVGQVASLHCYPVSSCHGMASDNGYCSVQGLGMLGLFNKQFIIVRPASEEFSRWSPGETMKECYTVKMPSIDAYSDGTQLVLSSLGHDSLMVKPVAVENVDWATVKQFWRAQNICGGVDLGDKAAKWLQKVLALNDVRLYQMVLEKWCVVPGRSAYGNYVITVKDSIQYINQSVASRPPLTTKYFRPNIVIHGSNPLDEHSWKYMAIGRKVLLTRCCPDTKIVCSTTTASNVKWKPTWEATPTVSPHVLITDGLSYVPDLGLNAFVLKQGSISVGDFVYVAEH